MNALGQVWRTGPSGRVRPGGLFRRTESGVSHLVADDIFNNVPAGLSVTLGALTLSAAATVSLSGALAKTLGALTLVSEGTVAFPPNDGALAVTLGALTLTGSGTVEVKGAAAVTLGALALSAAAAVTEFWPYGDVLTLTVTAVRAPTLSSVEIAGPSLTDVEME